MFKLCCKITCVVALISLNSVSAQDSLRVEKFNVLALRVQKMMSKKGHSLEHLTVVHRQLKEFSDVDPERYKSISEQRISYNLSERIRYINVKSKAYDLQQALVSMTILKQEKPQNEMVQALETKTKSKAQKVLLKNLTEKQVNYTFEPAISLYTLGKPPSEFAFFNSSGMDVMFSLAGYKTFNLRPSKKIGAKQNYVFSQAGLKVDYFYGMLIPQLSTMFTQTSGIDLGYAFNFGNKQTEVDFYSINISAYYPMDILSIGLNARILSDFKENHFLHYGISLKYNLKLGPKVTDAELKSIENNIENINIPALQ